jgi:hypothetical protein
MKDIPFFPTEYGVASLGLQEIPYRKEAYIQILQAEQENIPLLLGECGGFCRACGAEKIYWSGGTGDREPALRLLRMTGTAWVDPSKLEQLFPVTNETVTQWREIYNRRMAHVPQSRTLSFVHEKEILERGGAYFVHHSGTLLGIGWLEGSSLLAIASVQPGAGERVAHTLMSLAEGEQLSLEVLSCNQKAISLYERLGFLVTGMVREWYEWPEK